ncbi:SLAP domain-containing protein [Desulfosporosinus nitroreducens]|uniref:SLAP domain-containing protein n=1 Tax=Desulfosporosinus nitroreducens TaxID=2018668 RepID=A0ABT8QSS4_9FIRM|nr:SLAP domain-containing protein [Desulfosporosinus nitroreducens]MDO0824408.1 SLAP domain-containing protein [Desulfosporosinus nitroreducens]
MLLKFPKIFKGKEADSEFLDKDIFEVNSSDQNSEEMSEPSVTEGRVTIDFTSASSTDGALLVGFFINNGYSQKVKFKNVPLVLLDSNRQILAQQSFSGETIGEVIGGSAKACVVRFKPDNVFTKDIPEGCQMCFDVRPKRSKNIKIQYQALPESISVDKKKELEEILAKLPLMKYGEVDFSPLWAKITTESDLLATVIIRNSTAKPINLEQIPLAIIDAHQEELARGVFDVKNIAIEPYKAILWTFNFKHALQDRDIDLSSWHIDVIEKNTSKPVLH